MNKFLENAICIVATLFFSIQVFGEENNHLANDTIPAQNTTDEYKKFRFGGYGEFLFQQMNYGPDRYTDPAGAPKDKRSYISLPRAIMAFDYKFRDDIILGSELEIEYGGAGSAMEIEYGPGGEAREYETEIEKGGEVVLEQLHITKIFLNNKLNVRAGHMIVPVGLTNAHHEPIFYFGTTRPEGETALIPCTWHETGISIFGKLKAFEYNLMVVNGLDPMGFSSDYWVGSGKQGVFETTTMTSPAFVARFDYSGVKGLRVGVSGYLGNTAKNASKPQKMAAVNGQVSILSADAQYKGHNVLARGNFLYGNLGDSKQISKINSTLSKNAPYSRTSVAKGAMTYYAEAGYNVLSFFDLKEKLYPFVHYEYYNTMEKVEQGVTADSRFKRNVFSFGVNYFPLPNLVVKADYGTRRISDGDLNNENTFGISVGYVGWFFKN